MLPSHSNVAVLTEFNAPLQVRPVPIPDPLESGSLLVRIDCATVCGTDLHIWAGDYQTGRDLSDAYVLGHECVGTIVEFGPDARADSFGTTLDIGDRVIWTSEPCGQCSYCTVRAQPGLCRARRGLMTMPSTRFPYLTGAFAEYGYVLPGSGRVRVPQDVKSTWAAAASCALRTTMHAFERLGGVLPTDSIVIQGAGPIGLFCVAVARSMGAATIIVIGADDRRLAVAQAWGADAVLALDLGHEHRRTTILEMTGGDGADIVIEASGVASAFVEGIDIIRPGGTYVLAGTIGDQTCQIAPGHIVTKQLTILGSWISSVAHYRQAIDFLSATQGTFDFDLMFTDQYSMAQVADALADMAAGRVIKPVIMTNHGT